MNCLATRDELVAQQLQHSLASGELRGTPGLDLGDGCAETPAGLRVPFKILEDAGFAPPEIAWMDRAEQLRRDIAAAADEAQAQRLRGGLADVMQH